MIEPTTKELKKHRKNHWKKMAENQLRQQFKNRIVERQKGLKYFDEAVKPPSHLFWQTQLEVKNE